MKRLTKREVIRNAKHVISIGYGKAQHLLSMCNRDGYTAGYLGWYSDIFYFGDIAISTGYQSFGDINPSSKLIKKYDNKADKIFRSTKIKKYETKRRKINEIINEFIQECLC